MSKEYISSKIYNALKLKYEAKIAESEATLEIYFNNPVAIGEHPQQLEEMDKLLIKIADNNSKLEELVKRFMKYEKIAIAGN